MDGLGSLRSVTDDTGAPLESRNYAPYGEPYGTTGSSQTDFGFTGEQTDENGLLYLRARYYNSELGVFPSLDPLEGNVAQPMTFNGYSYVQGNVINMIDPSGMIFERPETWNACGNTTLELFSYSPNLSGMPQFAQIPPNCNDLENLVRKFLNGLRDTAGRWITKGVKQRVLELLIDSKAQYFWQVFFPNDPGYPYGTTYSGHINAIEQDQGSLKKVLTDWNPCPDPMGIRTEAWEWANLTATSLSPHTRVEDLPNGIMAAPAIDFQASQEYLIQTADGKLKRVSYQEWLQWAKPNITNQGSGYICPGCHGNNPTWSGPLNEKPLGAPVPTWAYIAPYLILAGGIAVVAGGIEAGLLILGTGATAS
jgi:RHS repeat-associated protein